MPQPSLSADVRDASPSGLAVAAAAGTGIALAAFMVAPRAAPFLLLAAALPALAVSQPRAITLEELGRAPLVMLLAFLAYLFVNGLWAIDRIEALGKAALSTAIVGALWLSWRGLVRLPDRVVDHLARAVAVAFVLGVVYLAVEEVGGHQIKRAVFNSLPLLRPSAKHIAVEDDTVSSVELYLSNRSIGALVLALWPTVLLVGWRGIGPRLVVLGMLALAALVALRSNHETSALALILSAVVLVLALRWRAFVLCLVAAGWMIATLLVVPIVSHPIISGLHAAAWLPKSARHRLVIWEFTVEQVARAPMLGIGIGSGKILDARREKRDPPPGYQFERRGGTHAHNVYLQTWYELGAVGAMLLCAAGLSLLAALTRLDPRAQPAALATFAAAATIGAFSWGMWQPWFMAAFGMCALLLLVALEADGRRRTQARPAPIDAAQSPL